MPFKLYRDNSARIFLRVDKNVNVLIVYHYNYDVYFDRERDRKSGTKIYFVIGLWLDLYKEAGPCSENCNAIG